jgi:tRNA G37 N-methylase Trm5
MPPGRTRFELERGVGTQLGPRIRTVVNKTDATGGPFRVFPMEVLAGEPNLETRVVENGLTFQLDYGKACVPFTPISAPAQLNPRSKCSGLQLARAQRRFIAAFLPRPAPAAVMRRPWRSPAGR